MGSLRGARPECVPGVSKGEPPEEAGRPFSLACWSIWPSRGQLGVHEINKYLLGVKFLA